MSHGIQHDLHAFATDLIQRRGGLVDWPAADRPGTAVLTPDLAAELHADDELVSLTSEAGGEGVCVNLATSFLETAGHLLEGVPRVAALRLPDAYLKRGSLDEALGRTFSWLNAKVLVRETRAVEIEYHTWSFHATLRSEDRWESKVTVTINSRTGISVEFPDPLRQCDFRPHEAGGPPADDTYRQAAAEAKRRLVPEAAGFFQRMDGRLERRPQAAAGVLRCPASPGRRAENAPSNTGHSRGDRVEEAGRQVGATAKAEGVGQPLCHGGNARPDCPGAHHRSGAGGDAPGPSQERPPVAHGLLEPPAEGLRAVPLQRMQPRHVCGGVHERGRRSAVSCVRGAKMSQASHRDAARPIGPHRTSWPCCLPRHSGVLCASSRHFSERLARIPSIPLETGLPMTASPSRVVSERQYL